MLVLQGKQCPGLGEEETKIGGKSSEWEMRYVKT